jgi:hypothetical protein
MKVTSGVVQPQGVGEDPLTFYTKIFIRFLQVVFSTFEKGSYRWEPDMELTDLVISDQGSVGREVVEKRPAIMCLLGPANWMNISMDQFKSFDFATGRKTHTDLVSGAMVYACLAQDGVEARRIAWIAGYATRALKRNLLRAGMHRVGENVNYGPEMDGGVLFPDPKPSVRMVQVMVPFFFQDTYSIGPVDNLLLKQLDLRLTSEVNSPAPDGKPALRDPAMRGKLLQIDKTVSLTQRISVTSKPSPQPPKK